MAIKNRNQAIELRAVGIDTLSELAISADGQYALGQSSENVIQWSTLDGRVHLQIFERKGLSPMAMETIGQKLQIAFSDMKNMNRSELLSWQLDRQLLSSSLAVADEEVTQKFGDLMRSLQLIAMVKYPSGIPRAEHFV